MQRSRPTGPLARNARQIASINSTMKFDDGAERHPARAHRALRAPGACGRDVDLSA
jgi:hypothetical protein